jgi:PII-like signaling protein
VDQDCVKLTRYFSDRHKIGGRTAGEAQTAQNDSGEVAVSIVLRGADGSGLMQQVRTRTVLDETLKLTCPGFVTLERGRLLSGEIDPLGLQDAAGEATRLTIYFNREDHVYQVPAFEVICELLHRRGIAGATALAGLNGGGQRGKLTGRSTAAPVMIVAVTSGDRLGTVLPELGGLLRRPLFTLEQVRLCKRDGQLLALPPPMPAVEEDSGPLLQELSVYASGSARHEGQPLHRAIIRRLHETGVTRATTVRGIWGFHGDRAPHGGGHHAPAVTIVTEKPERISAAFSIIDELTAEHGLVTSNVVTSIQPRI